MEHDISRKTIMQLQVTLDELISNVIKYAWPAGGRHELSVRMTATATDVRIDLVDDGQAFDPRTAPPPEGSARRRRPGGVGIHMVKQLVDDIEYWRRNGRNHITLTKRFKPGDRPGGV